MEEMAGELETAADRRDLGKLYAITRQLSGRKSYQKKKPVRGKDDKLLTKTEEQLVRWREHFQEVLNRAPPEDPPELTPATQDLDIRIYHKKRNLQRIKQDQEGESSWGRPYTTRSTKIGGEVLVNVLYSLLLKIWDREAIPK